MILTTRSGGEEVLVDQGGKDASDAFEDVSHSEEARRILDTLVIGTLDKTGSVSEPSLLQVELSADIGLLGGSQSCEASYYYRGSCFSVRQLGMLSVCDGCAL